jgi:integrase
VSVPKSKIRRKKFKNVASVHRKSGASGKESPYWNAKFKGPDGTVWTLTTKLREKKPARALARTRERAAETAYNGHLTHQRAQKFLAECAEITHGDGYKKSGEFLDECLRQSTGSGLNIPTAEKYFRDWLDAKEQVGRTSESTLTRYAPILNRFVAFLPEVRRRSPLASITASAIDGFLHAEKVRGLSNVTANAGVRVLRIVFNTARRKGVITTNPAEAVDLLQEEPDKRLPFTPDQVRALLEVADTEWRGIILLGFYSGMRLGDAARLTWANVDLENRVVAFEAQKTLRRKKGANKNTVVDLHADLMAYFGGLPMSDDARAAIFPDLSRRPVGSANGLSAGFHRLMDKAGILAPLGAAKEKAGRVFRALSFHSLRHAFVTQLHCSGVPIEVRKELAGHRSDAMSLNYTHVSRALTAAAIAQIPSIQRAA